jgi:SAM-dependent methyltransferase
MSSALGSQRLPSDRDLLYRVLAASASDAREEVIGTALDLLAVEADHAVLELGCGTGDILSRIAARVLRGIVVGVDTSDVMLRHARRRNRVFLERGRAGVQRINRCSLAPLGDEVFDRVLGVHVVYFWSDPPRQLEAIRRVLRPGGSLVLAFRPSGEVWGQEEGRRLDGGFLEPCLEEHGFDAVESFAGGSPKRPLTWLRALRV